MYADDTRPISISSKHMDDLCETLSIDLDKHIDVEINAIYFRYNLANILQGMSISRFRFEGISLYRMPKICWTSLPKDA